MAEYLLDKLIEYSKSDYYPLHMPGHKRRLSHFEHPFDIDITEIDGFDNLHHAEGVLLEAQKRAADLYGADETYYLVNGSTCGILAAVSACVPRGGRILMARNCHKAAYHAVFLNGLRAEYLYPSVDMVRGINGSISPEDVRKALERQQGQEAMQSREVSQNGKLPAGQDTMQKQDAVLITSPTYDGVVSDIRRIAEEVHKAGAVLIVDEAHGAHFAMHSYFPETALACGADIVINSLHKTMPSLTQTALLHVKGGRVNRERLRKYLGIYQSSSPSYVLMAGMDACVNLMQKQGAELFERFAKRLERMRKELGGMKRLHLVDGMEEGLRSFDFDRSKILISTERAGISGPELSELLRREYHLEVEMEAERYITAIMTVADTEEGFERLTQALLRTDRELKEKVPETDEWQARKLTEIPIGTDRKRRTEILETDRQQEKKVPKTAKCQAEKYAETDRLQSEKFARTAGKQMKAFIKNREVLTIEEAESCPKKQVELQDSAGYVSAEFVYLYPPGIPLLVPGEEISEALLEQLIYDQSVGLKLQGMTDYSGKRIYVVSQEQQRQ